MAHRFGRLGLLRSAFGVAMEMFVTVQSWFAPKPDGADLHPKNILVLRNNDFGDLLVTTPLFEALRQRFPDSRIVVAVGKWNLPALQHNPFIDEVIALDAPWYNHFIKQRSVWAALKFIWCGEQAHQLRARKFDLFIDVVGSHFGAMLGMRAGIPWRIGVKGYAGGHSGMTKNVVYLPNLSVGRANLRVAELLGATALPAPRPQVYLSPEEIVFAKETWDSPTPTADKRRVVIAPGIGSEGRGWPIDRFAELAKRLGERGDLQIMVLGGKQDVAHGQQIHAACPSAADRCGAFNLRQTYSAVSLADLVICNNSMLSHVAAAFQKPTIVLLGPRYRSTRIERGVWGYDGLSQFLGREGENTQIATVDEAIAAFERGLNTFSRVG